jgi:hypothetical protein
MGREKVKNRIISVSLAVALILSVGLIGCAGEEVPEIPEYDLIVSSTEGGDVTSPDEDTFAYDEGTVVYLVAEADEGYQFVNWTGDVGTIGNVNAAATTITMDGDYEIVANFALEVLEIRDWHDLDAIRDNMGGSYPLMNDLDSTTAGYEELASPTANQGKGWQPIHGPFTGSFDGQGCEIRDMFINRPDENDIGLFGQLSWLGLINNVGVVNATVIGYRNVGGLVGVSWGLVSNSHSTGSMIGVGYVGGLVGVNTGTVSNSFCTSSVTGSWHVGGLVGRNFGGMSNCCSTGSVTGSWQVGGLVGQKDRGTVSNSYSTGSVIGSWQVGGLMGMNYGSVSDSFWDIQTSGQTTSAGGTGKTTAQMQEIVTFSDAGWNIIAVANPSTREPSYIWNVVDGQTYPFLSWQSVS